MHCGDDHIVLVEMGRPGQIPCRHRGVECDLGDPCGQIVHGRGRAGQAVEILDPRQALAVTAEDERAENPEDRCHPGRGADLVAGSIQALQGLGERHTRSRRRCGHRLGPLVRARAGLRSEEPEQHASSRGADAIVHAQQPEPRQLVRRVVEQPNRCGEVLHMRGLHESETSVLPVRDPASRELELDQVAVMSGAN